MINGSFVFGLDDDDKDVFQTHSRLGCGACNYNFYFSHSHTLSRHQTIPGHGERRKNFTPQLGLYDTRYVVHQTNHHPLRNWERGYYQAYDSFIPK